MIEHSGVVEHVEGDMVRVKITSQSACGSCHAREACGLSESKDKFVDVTTPHAAEYALGEAVTVGIRRCAGAVAVFFAYAAASVVLLAVLIVSIYVLRLGEGAAALIALASVGVYYFVLWLFRRKLENTIHFTITKH